MRNQRKNKNQKLCAVSHKYIGNREVILVQYAVDYVKQLGYTVISKKQELQNIFASYIICWVCIIATARIMGLT